MENYFNLVPLIVILPAAGLLINLFAGKYLGEKGVSIVAAGASASALLVSVLLWIALVDADYAAALVNMPLLHSGIRSPSAGREVPRQVRADHLRVPGMHGAQGPC